jgi:hypothetical protein
VFVSGLEWLRNGAHNETSVGRILLRDREAVLISTYEPASGNEKAVFGAGFDNGMVVILRRLIETGFMSEAETVVE